MSEQMQKIHDKIAECDREAALRGFSDTGFPRLWFSALSRVAGLELARPPRSKCVNLGDGSIPSPVTRDTSPAICELQQQNDELRDEIARLREERRWVPAGERLPTVQGDDVLTLSFFSDGSPLVCIGWHNGIEWMHYIGRGPGLPVSHWQPLPPGPEAAP